MRIKKFIHLLILLPLFMGTVVIGLLQTSFYSEKVMRDEIEIAQKITVESFNLLRLGRDIALHPREERAPRQWHETFYRLHELVQQIEKTQYSHHLEVMRDEKKMLKEIFTTLIDLVNSNEVPTSAYQFRLTHLENEMMLHSHTLSNEALQLMSQVRQDLATQRELLNYAVTGLILLFVLVLTIILKRWGTRVLNRIEQLRQVTEIISTGNFKHLINNVDDDELGDFARAMDLMSQKLKQIEERVLERKNQLKAVNEQLNEMLFALDFSGIGIEIIDVETGSFLYVNACTCEMLGYSESEMLSMTVSDINPPFNSYRLQQFAEQIKTTGKGHFESVHYRRDGSSFPIDITVYYQAAKENKAARFITFVSDITERKAFEEDLFKTKVAAENANHAKSVFLANMSHELRTPLNAILGFAQLLSRNNTIPEAVRNDVQTIIRCGQQLLSLINDVLEISSIETGHLKTRFDVINLPKLLSSLVETLQITNRNVWFHFEPAPNLPEFIETDFGKLRSILQNLLSNAVKFTHQGSITLQVYTHIENTQEMLCVAVTDTGVGIEESDKEFLFKPFFQSQYGMNLGAGTGLGLYISQEYAKLLGGQITVDSQPNVGSTFLATLPLIRTKEIEKVAVQHRGDVLGLAAGQTTKRILVVDDQPENQYLISELLKQVGFQVSIAANGMQAVQSFQKWKPHFIYMDMRMPEMNGIEATRIIRAMSGGRYVPIIALTASLLEETHPDILEAGCNAVLRKPVEPSVLFETIATYLNLEFEYGNRLSQPMIEKEFEFSDLSALPDEIRQRLYNAAMGLDTELIDVIISGLETDYPDVALYLKQLVEEFQFDFICSLTALTQS